MRAVDPSYAAQAGEVLFLDYATEAQLAAKFPAYAPPAPSRPTVPKSTVMARVTAAGKMAAAQSALWAEPDQFAKWFAPDQPSVNCDDQATVAFISALGLDPAVILAP
ncbi:hypothetical protein [Mesorhizobium sp.]|uniref:hypothetical protein n=1 Tax=Mesorhizobium sp. TaxID=1871066 RepID=UPI000FE807F7|nr:hypothetical protein [Mesorhizobium sp.]RWD69590.1 MAG: hypothetical protein EOS37_17475 [Mesorhizobium sp.]